MGPMYGADQAGVEAYAKHVVIDEDNKVTPAMVADWLTGFGAHVGLRIGTLTALPGDELSMVEEACRQIIHRYVAGDVLDTAYELTDGTAPGAALRKEALEALALLIPIVDTMRDRAANDATQQGAGGADYALPLPRVSMTMRW